MQPCAALCTLRPEFVNMTLNDQLALIRGCHEANAAAYAQCAIEKRRLVQWIEDEK